VADVFAFQQDGTVQAITADGTTAWTANAYAWSSWPDFQGGLVVISPDQTSIQKLDGKTGQVAWTYPCPRCWSSNIAVHPDGTIFEYETVSYEGEPSGLSWRVVGIDPATGSAKFSVPVEGDYLFSLAPPMLIAGDGNLYVLHIQVSNIDFVNQNLDEVLETLVVSSSGDSRDIQVASFRSDGISVGSMITNADQGILVSWEVADGQGSGPEVDTYIPHMSLVSATGVREVTAPNMPCAAADISGMVTPVLQAQDGSFVGVACRDFGFEQPVMVSFDASGGVRWMVPVGPNETPQIATADGGVIGTSGITYDANGMATGSMGSLPTYSWLGYAYQDGDVQQVKSNRLYVAASFWPFAGANNSANGAAASQPQFAPLATCTTTPGCIGPYEAIYLALADLLRNLQNPAVVAVGSDGTQFTLASLAQAKVFGKLGTRPDGTSLYSASGFIEYLRRKMPLFYDGLNSQFCNDELTPLSVINPPCVRFLGVTWLGQTVASYFRAHATGTDAETATPSNPLMTFFNPPSILLSSLGRNQANEGLLFHEALHGFTGIQDLGILGDLGYDDALTTSSCNITKYIQQTVLGYAVGLDPTTNNADCDPATSPPPGIKR
jgi:hypothetical protein